MCRLLAVVHSGSSRPLRESVDAQILEEFRRLAEVHRDGWGAAWLRSQALSSYLSHISALRDGPMFEAILAQPANSLVIHERWASPGISLLLDNQQPFIGHNVAFAHNGTIGNAEGNIVRRPARYRENLGLMGSTTMSDSRIYADLFFLQLTETRQSRSETEPASVQNVHQALTLTLASLRQDYPEASFNNVIQTPDFTFVTRAHADRPKPSELLRQGYERAGWGHRIESYYELGYTTIEHAGSVTSIASSSGYAASDPWTKLPNNTVLAISHQDSSVQTLPLPF